MATKRSKEAILISEAEESDLDSLTTIVPRAFHPVNPYIKRALPDTPSVRAWWKEIFTSEINDRTCHVLVARNPQVNTESIVGVLTLRLMHAEDRGAGFWTLHHPAPDIDQGLFTEMIAGMLEYRTKLITGKPSYLLELFGVDHAWKGHKMGIKLLARAGEIADGSGHDIFVQANAGAKSFYEKLGFVCEAKVPIGEDGSYVEYMLVRRYDG